MPDFFPTRAAGLARLAATEVEDPQPGMRRQDRKDVVGDADGVDLPMAVVRVNRVWTVPESKPRIAH